MKVAKVVFNSVSHDARVLKEAEAIAEAGFDVVIVGIQDANNSVPIQTLENGVVIRRVAWQARAFRPSAWSYLWQLLLAVAGVAIAAFVAVWLVENFQTIASVVTFRNALYLLCAATVLYVGAGLWGQYARRRRSFLSIKKREHDEFLKYEAELSGYRRRQSAAAAADAFPPAASPDGAKKRRRSRALHRRIPRPLMGGLAASLRPANLRRWKVVFAREKQVSALLAEEQPQIVHAHDLAALPVAAKFARATGAKLVFDAHEMYDHLAQSEDELSELNGKILRKYAPDVDTFITINDSIARYYASSYPAFPRALIIKNATRYAEDFEYDGRLHAAAGLPPETRILIYQGGYAPKRGLISLLLSAEYLDPSWSLVFMGWGKLEEELRRVADSLKMKEPELDARIRFVPKVKQSELPYWTSGATLGAIPYENTGLNHWYCNPNKLWEYPNAGVPIIASPFPELRKTIEGNGIGWLLPDPLTPRDIAATINRLQPEELSEAARNCRRFIQEDNWSVYAERLKQAYTAFK
jgi:glycosyltransferase involved in cell wall biosynthesis